MTPTQWFQLGETNFIDSDIQPASMFCYLEVIFSFRDIKTLKGSHKSELETSVKAGLYFSVQLFFSLPLRGSSKHGLEKSALSVTSRPPRRVQYTSRFSRKHRCDNERYVEIQYISSKEASYAVVPFSHNYCCMLQLWFHCSSSWEKGHRSIALQHMLNGFLNIFSHLRCVLTGGSFLHHSSSTSANTDATVRQAWRRKC